MENLNLEGIPAGAGEKIKPFFEELIGCCPEKIHSLYVTGSAVASDFNPKTSDVNSLIMLNDVHFDFFKFLAPLGKKFKSKGISAPLVMTPKYLGESLDVFPVEFLELKLIHMKAYGSDILKEIDVDHSLLRLQCEREIKTRLIGLWHGYISTLGEPDKIAQILFRSVKGCMPLFRSIILLKGEEPPLKKLAVIDSLQKVTDTDRQIFIQALDLRENPIKESGRLLSLFESYYGNLETVSSIVNALKP